MKKLLLALPLIFFCSPAKAQNVQCPTRPQGDNTNACASTAFVQAAVAGGGGGGGGSPFHNCVQINITGLPDKSVCERGPFFVWNDPTSVGNPAGRNMGCQFWVGNNPTATPAINSSINCTMYIDNNNRATLGGLNIVTLFVDLGPGWADTSGIGLEVEVNNAFAANSGTDPFGSSPIRKNGITVTTGFGTAGRITSAYTNWGAERNGSGWVDTAFAASSAYNYGWRCIADPGGDPDLTAAFKTACISDESDSANVLKISRTHTNIIDLSSDPAFGDFVRGKSTVDTGLRFRNAADHVMLLSVDSGSAAANISAITLSDRQTGKWSFVKDISNNFLIANQALSTSPFTLNGVTDRAAFGGDVALSKTLQFVGSVSGTITIQPQAAAGTFNFNLPTTSGTVGQCLASGGGGAAVMTWATCSAAGTVTNAAALTANLPVIGAGGNAVAVGTVSGNTTTFATFSGAATAGRCIQTDISGNLVIAAGACGTSGGTSNPPGGSPGQVQYQVNATTFGGITGATTNGVAMTLAGGLVTADPTLALGVASKQYVDATASTAAASAADSKVAKAGDTMTGNLTINSSGVTFNLNTTDTNTPNLVFSNQGNTRWILQDFGAEAAGNVGSDFYFSAFGAGYLSSPFIINRADGHINLSSTTSSTSTTTGALVVAGGIGVGGTIQVSSLIMPTVNADIEMGSMSSVNTPLIDFHSSGFANDYDARILVSGGNGASGAGLVTLSTPSLTITSVQPGFSCVHSPGASSETISCSSDRTLKRKIENAGSALAKIDSMRIRTFEAIATGERKPFGIIAQELEETHPKMVHVDAKGSLMAEQPDPWMLVKAIQELKAEIEQLRKVK